MVRKKGVKAPDEDCAGIEEDDEGESEGSEVGRANFLIHDGTRMLRVQALKDCWALQYWSEASEEAKRESAWVAFKWLTDLGNVAGKIFDIRLKNCEVTTLKELSEMAKSIRDDVRKEFSLQQGIQTHKGE